MTVLYVLGIIQIYNAYRRYYMYWVYWYEHSYIYRPYGTPWVMWSIMHRSPSRSRTFSQCPIYAGLVWGIRSMYQLSPIAKSNPSPPSQSASSFVVLALYFYRPIGLMQSAHCASSLFLQTNRPDVVSTQCQILTSFEQGMIMSFIGMIKSVYSASTFYLEINRHDVVSMQSQLLISIEQSV